MLRMTTMLTNDFFLFSPDGASAGAAPAASAAPVSSSSETSNAASESAAPNAPSEKAGSETSDSGGDDTDYFGSVGEQLDLDIYLEEAPTPPAETPPAQTPEAKEPPKETPPTQEQKAETQEQKAQETQPPTQEQTQQPQLTQEQLQAQLQQWQDQAIEVLSTQVYTISEEDAALLQTEPEKILPKMAARVHVQAMQAAMIKTMEAVQRMLPQAIQSHLDTAKSQTDFETQFYSAFPKLKNADANRLAQITSVYRQSLNGRRPSREELINEVGQMAHAILGIPLDEPTQQQPTPQTVSQPYTPSAAHGAAPARAPVQMNEFEALAAAIESGAVDV